ncbi:MAG: Ni/Fe-hydrogenase cytochrome b subunit [Nitrospirae bacterium CG_4_9_14_3_um_filter_53_35]|nr:MAG: hypothetical protein AUK29_02170 [Nitrospirae bacterium CG2_30_53_67]PIS35952.1 MAG: Ni/Fe-hydrogenase cytochrome b subunit [Nitrospirae bacterium CG08_land_8_20_14_0_20_52_24]PIV82564.1 MAG: Ni/Fe-hydrogenase cytochrome b subunit [Nitrospirae bacterium CG17_big_fil_post_rev_8_21_14_2_50_50_9]PIW85598.1 MAG: Ni/Fe-hydrogenase cytochrome b subunit [Nitrospirae bacterium CG_4_8_14_3_um_filter_50_41]PIX85178.1 MAG: Ni/Fe-hydrogenase cytochrome b subunit [Nitrospirae bacterium CG_4_10_14_3_
MNRLKDIPLISRSTWPLFFLMALGAGCMVYRFAMGLGASTHLSDSFPWGIWVGMDIFVGVALAAGGFTLTAAIYIFNWKKYKPVARPAVLTAFLGYLLLVMGVIIDIGKPLSFWHPLVMWQYRSVLFEVVWCIALYTAVLAMEFSPALLDGAGMHGLASFMKNKLVLFPLVIAGVTLSFHHQSSLGNLFLIVPDKLHHLWYTPLIGLLYFLSAVAAGMAMVSFESIVSSWAFKRGYEVGILRGLAKGSAVSLLIYLAVRFTDLAVRGNFPLMLEGSRASVLFFIEIMAGVIVPMLLLASASREGPVGRILGGQILVMAGVILNRFDTNFLTQAAHGGSYFPSWMEIAITAGVISFGVFLYRIAVLRLEVFPSAEVQH